MIRGILKRLPEIIAHVTSPSHYLYEGSKGDYKSYRRPGSNSLWDMLADLSVAWSKLDKYGKCILHLYYLECWTDDAISAELEVERSTVTRARHRALNQVIKFLVEGELPTSPVMRRGRVRDRKTVQTLVVFYED